MRIVASIFVGLVAVPAVLASPASAKDASLSSHANSNARAVEETPPPPGCHAYQQAADGSWIELDCREGSGPAPAAARGKSASGATRQTSH